MGKINWRLFPPSHIYAYSVTFIYSPFNSEIMYVQNFPPSNNSPVINCKIKYRMDAISDIWWHVPVWSISAVPDNGESIKITKIFVCLKLFRQTVFLGTVCRVVWNCLGKLFCSKENIHCNKWPKNEQIINPSGHTAGECKILIEKSFFLLLLWNIFLLLWATSKKFQSQVSPFHLKWN